ncbi:Nitronate monooxygenase [Variovorax sp. SRS16]|uniref:nitronate monooxygenase n=1 Tax=Variovorax sp. SRS16 TaxID=282217 RepID=UPI001317BEC9|nr:nitronate monooxygenase [Variovorax sp. SRS16]VTU28083.1 Nitronate monooxygenase [Variovorax sp. SRS16]
MTPAALHTPLVQILDCEWPILCAGMGGVARHRLAAAVSNAGGFGCLGMVREPPERVRAEIEAYRRLSDRAFAVNLIPAATERGLLDAQVEVCLALSVPVIALFWDVDADLVRRLKAQGVRVIHQVGSAADAEAALRAGADVLIAQGVEAGGHVRGQISTFALLPEIVALSPVPVVASGGIASGEALVAALALGAQGISCGSAFLATHEANAHAHHKQRLVESGAADTLLTEKFFRNWPMPAPVRVLRNAVTEGRHDALYAQRATPVIGAQDGAPVHLFSTDSPLEDATGDIDDMAIYAGQSCGQIHDLCSAGDRLRQLVAQAEACLDRLEARATAPRPVEAPAATPAPAASAGQAALVAVLQELLAAERAGARVAASSLSQTRDAAARRLLEQVRQGEADSCRRLTACLAHLGIEPTREIGAFHDKAMAIANLDERLAFVDRGQRWVIRRIEAQLPLCDDAFVKAELDEILKTHVTNSEAMQRS